MMKELSGETLPNYCPLGIRSRTQIRRLQISSGITKIRKVTDTLETKKWIQNHVKIFYRSWKSPKSTPTRENEQIRSEGQLNLNIALSLEAEHDPIKAAFKADIQEQESKLS